MKIARIISIIMILLENKIVSATKLAKMLEVTTRTIYRDVETINLSGIPIVTYPGVNGGIGIMEQYKIEKKLFTLSDISALLTGLGSIPPSMSNEEVLNAIVKIKGLIPAEQIRDVEFKSSQLAIDHTPWLGNKSQDIDLNKIKTALNENRFISFEYSAQNGAKSKRKLEPHRLILKNSNWYIQGYCIDRNDFRIFKLSRISSLELLEETFISRDVDYKPLDISMNIEKKSIPIKLLIDESVKDLLIGFCGEENIEPYRNNKLLVHFPFIEDEYSYGMIIRLGDKCECLEPENVRLEIIRRVESLLNTYKKYPTQK